MREIIVPATVMIELYYDSYMSFQQTLRIVIKVVVQQMNPLLKYEKQIRFHRLLLIGQIQMVMESYRNEYNRKMDELIKKQNIQNRINIRKENEVDNKSMS